jgi:methionine synthase I (cobalamin-dependent)
MMEKLQTLLAESGTILLDGAMGTILMGMGLVQGAPPEEWNVLHPDRMVKVHQAYIDAGSRMILTNSFGGTSFRLKLHNLQDRAYELNRAAAEVARRAADGAAHTVLVGGSMGPTGEIFVPMGEMQFDDAVAAFAEQARGLADGGVDLLWIETMSDLQEVEAAVTGARRVTDLPIAATMTFDTHGRTMMGVTPVQAIEKLRGFGLIAIGANCGNGPAEIESVISQMRAVDPEAILIAKANAGIPKLEGDNLIYDGTPQVMGEYAHRVRALGANLIGGCCGNSPEHITMMGEALAGRLDISEAPVVAAVTETPAEKRPPRRERRRRRR